MQTLQPNTLLQGGRYRIERMLGQGGFGITYLAFQSGLERQVAIKEFFMKDFCERDESTSHVTLCTNGARETVGRFREKFLKEARNIAKLNHPHIVRIIDVFEENGTAYYVMEYAGGGSLADKLKAQCYLSESVATRYIQQVAEALDYIHQRKMNHLDIKPANIMLNEDDNAVLIDFGLAKQYDAVTGGQTSTTTPGISEGYAPMEQYRQGGVCTFTPETDIYSLGATFFKLLTGETPPNASDVIEDGIPVDLLKAKGVSQTLIGLITHAMESKKKDRIHSATEFMCEMKGVHSASVNSDATIYNTNNGDGDSLNEETILVNPRISAQSPSSDRISTVTVNGVSFDMVKVKAGTFMMGATPEMENPFDDEKPVHRVTLTKDYYIGKTEVTQALWKAVMGRNLWKTVMGSNPSYFKGDNKPVEHVSWNDCQKFISKLNSMTGKRFRLPTEAEWEFAARGGNWTKGYQYSGSNSLDDVAWFDENSGDTTHDVATKQPNELGLYDMSGNVWEWCADWYGSYSSNAQYDPVGPSSGSIRVHRGGSWYYRARICRSSNRGYFDPGNWRSYLGLRLVLSE